MTSSTPSDSTTFTALDDVSIAIRPGTFHALLGENGAGKSTLVKCMMGFYHATDGQLMVDAVQRRDMPVVQACCLIFAATYVFLNLVADILSIVTNPRLLHPK